MRGFIRNWLRVFLYPRPVLSLFHIPRYFKDYLAFRRMEDGLSVRLIDTHPCLEDWTVTTPFDGHYFYQGAWLARKLANTIPEFHVDVGSSVMMVSVLSAMVKTVFVDYRPLHVDLSGLDTVSGNITQLPFRDDSLVSVSCQHVIEHIGLGRYGDPLDPEGSVKAAKELERVIKPGGKLYLSLPVGRERVCFNAHRVHAPDRMVELFRHMKLLEFSYVSDESSFSECQSLDTVNNSDYACGMYMFEKLG